LDDDFAYENIALVLGIVLGLTLSINFADKFLKFSLLEIVSELLKIKVGYRITIKEQMDLIKIGGHLGQGLSPFFKKKESPKSYHWCLELDYDEP
jgi:hypothetical protein